MYRWNLMPGSLISIRSQLEGQPSSIDRQRDPCDVLRRGRCQIEDCERYIAWFSPTTQRGPRYDHLTHHRVVLQRLHIPGHETRAYRIHPDAVLGPLDGQVSHDSDDTVLRTVYEKLPFRPA